VRVTRYTGHHRLVVCNKASTRQQ